MNEIPWLTLLVFLPALFALFIAFVPKENAATIRTTAFIGSLVTLAISIVIWTLYHPGITTSAHQFQLEDKLSWIPSLHINYYLGLDGISLLMVLMTTGIFPFAIGVSFREITERTRQFYCWMLLMETAVLGVFLSLNLVLFYVFWEAMLIPMYFIIGIWGGPKRIYATVKFFLYTMAGSMVMLVSIMALYFVAGSNTFDLPLLQRELPGHLLNNMPLEVGLFLGFFFAFGIKAPIWPFHTWVPDAYAEAPTGGTIILVALKMGLYGFIPVLSTAVSDCRRPVGSRYHCPGSDRRDLCRAGRSDADRFEAPDRLFQRLTYRRHSAGDLRIDQPRSQWCSDPDGQPHDYDGGTVYYFGGAVLPAQGPMPSLITAA